MIRDAGSPNVNIEMYDWHCANCNCLQSMTEDLNERLRANHKTFYCVNGHPNVYNTPTPIDEVECKLMNEYAKNAQLEKEVERLNKSLINRIFKK